MKTPGLASVPRTKKSLVVKPETIRVLELGNPALQNLVEFSRKDCPNPNAEIERRLD